MISQAGEFIDYKDYTKKEIRNILHEASKIDGEFGITIEELKTMIGSPNRESNDSAWENGIHFTYDLNNNRKLEIDLLNNNVVHGVITTNDGKVYLVWK